MRSGTQPSAYQGKDHGHSKCTRDKHVHNRARPCHRACQHPPAHRDQETAACSGETKTR